MGRVHLLVEPGGFHVVHVVVLDLAEDPDALLGSLDLQWSRGEGCRGRGERQVPPESLWAACFGASLLSPALGLGMGWGPRSVGRQEHLSWSLKEGTDPLPAAKAGGRPREVLGRRCRAGQRQACLPLILPSSVKMASRSGGRQRRVSWRRLPQECEGWGHSWTRRWELSLGPGSSAR